MPRTELHTRKRFKNFAVLALIVGWCVLIWAVTMAKLAASGGI